MGVLRSLRSLAASPVTFAAAALVAALLAAAAERGIIAWRSSRAEPGGGAWWIWAGDLHPQRQSEPVAFYALRDFEIAVPSPAWLSIAAAETYLVFLNGKWLGGNSYREGSAIDRYRVGDLLRVGRNRLAVELRSSRGAGGLLAALDLADASAAGSETTLVTDGSWRIFRQWTPEIFDPAAPLAGGEKPQIWEHPPTGRWRLRAAEGDRPIPFLDGVRPHRRLPVRVRRAVSGAAWIRLFRRRLAFPHFSPELLLDWGREVEGFLDLDLAPGTSQPGLVYLGSEPPDPAHRPPDEILLVVPGQPTWRSAHPHRFRYALMVGIQPKRRVRVLAVDTATAAALAPPPPQTGVFGIKPPPASNAVANAVWMRIRSQ